MTYYTINQVMVDEQGCIQENTIKGTYRRREAKKYLKLYKKIKPEDHFILSREYEPRSCSFWDFDFF